MPAQPLSQRLQTPPPLPAASNGARPRILPGSGDRAASLNRPKPLGKAHDFAATLTRSERRPTAEPAERSAPTAPQSDPAQPSGNRTDRADDRADASAPDREPASSAQDRAPDSQSPTRAETTNAKQADDAAPAHDDAPNLEEQEQAGAATPTALEAPLADQRVARLSEAPTDARPQAARPDLQGTPPVTDRLQTITQSGLEAESAAKRTTGPAADANGAETLSALETGALDEAALKDDPALSGTLEAPRAAEPTTDEPGADLEPPVFGSPRALDRLLAQGSAQERGAKRAAPDDAAARAPIAPPVIDRSSAQSRAGADPGAGDASAAGAIANQPGAEEASSREGDAGAQQESRRDLGAGVKAPARPPSKASHDAGRTQAAPDADQPESPNKGSVLAPAGAEHAPRLSLNAEGPASGPRIGATDRQEAQDRFAAAVARGLTAAVQQKGGSITLSMQPESLGSLRIRLDLSQGNVSARFEAATPEAHDLLTRSLDALRASLEAKGLNAERLHVEPLSASAGQGGPAGHGQDGGGARPHAQHANGFAHDAADGKSRGAFDGRQGAGPDRQDRGDRAEARAGMETPEGFDSWLRLGLDATA